MLQQAITLSIILSFLSAELLGVFTGGLVSAGYLAFFIEQPYRILSTLVLSVIVYAITRLIGKAVILYGRRRFMVTVIVGILLGWLYESQAYYISSISQDLRIIGYIIPGLLANDMCKQGIVRTLGMAMVSTFFDTPDFDGGGTYMRRYDSNAKIHQGYLIAAFVIGFLGVLLTWMLRRSTPLDYSELQLAAAKRMQQAEAVLLEVVQEENIPIEDIDLNRTGLIGPEWTPLTTTPGIEDAKRTSLDPNMAAVLVRYFKEAGLKSGDTVAVGTSGSFPGLLIATLCAARELELDVKVILSFCSSMYGATRPELNVYRILSILEENDLITFDLLAVSPGGTNDYGESALWPDSRELIFEMAEETGVEFIDYNDIEKSIARRLELFGEDIDCFVNVGGASANSGTSAYTLDFPMGLVLDPPKIPTTKNRGLMYEYAARGVPVVNMLNMRQMAADNGLAYDPVPMSEPGEGGVYYDMEYPVWISVTAAVLMLAVLAVGRMRWKDKEKSERRV